MFDTYANGQNSVKFYSEKSRFCQKNRENFSDRIDPLYITPKKGYIFLTT